MTPHTPEQVRLYYQMEILWARMEEAVVLGDIRKARKVIWSFNVLIYDAQDRMAAVLEEEHRGKMALVCEGTDPAAWVRVRQRCSAQAIVTTQGLFRALKFAREMMSQIKPWRLEE